MAYFDRFDVCEAYYVYAEQYHGGQGSKEYALHSVFLRLRFEPNGNVERHMSENAREILDDLVSGQRKLRDRR